ncbi:MAG TPA: cytochrome c family protein [Thermoanaerobaculia bacterium]|nr:cytochrome c family protein [Thermoanaerobaculia bacterium]
MKTSRRWYLSSVAAACFALLLLPSALSAAKGEHEFVGSTGCKKCHLKEWKSWAETKMANAFENLKPGVAADAKKKAGLDPSKDYTLDQTCVACHTTGYGKAGGFVSVEKTPDLVGVGCEMCHGPGGTYIKDGYMTMDNKEYKKADLVAVGMVDVVKKEQCLSCHNAESPFVEEGFVFDFEANKDKGTHEKIPLKYKH